MKGKWRIEKDLCALGYDILHCQEKSSDRRIYIYFFEVQQGWHITIATTSSIKYHLHHVNNCPKCGELIPEFIKLQLALLECS